MIFFLLALLLLLAAHALCDYALQTEWMAKNKNPLLNADGPVPWYYVLAAHALIHAGAVMLIGMLLSAPHVWIATAGFLEAGIHFSIDRNKCSPGGLTSGALPLLWDIHVDQAAHVAVKVAFAILFCT